MKSLEVAVNTPLHARILKMVKQRKDFSAKKMQDFHRQWEDADDSMKAYIHEKDVDKSRKLRKKFDGEVDYVTLEVPYVYAIVMTMHTYFSSVILGRSPVWQFTGRHGEGQDSIQALEAVMDYQLKVGGHLPVMYNWLYDLAKYSLGVVGLYWEDEQRVVSQFVEEQPKIMGVPFGKTKVVRKEQVVAGYSGNKLFNIRPYDFFPDPRVPIWRFQDGEFCLRQTNEGYHEILATEHAYPGYYVNIKELETIAKQGLDRGDEGSSRTELPFQPGEMESALQAPGFFRITEAYIRLIPAAWGLGDSKRQEVWCFTVANDKVVIAAKPLGALHGKFPFSVMEGNFGSEDFAKIGSLEIIRPLTDVLTWLVNSHFYNVRRVLNNQLVVDPSRVTMKDLTKPGQRIIRLKPEAYGQDVRGFIHQLQHYDVTRTHLTDVQFVEQMIQRVSSVADTVMGMQNPGGRKSATEVRNAVGMATTRLKTPIEYNSALALDPLAQMMVSNTQQFLSMERKYAIAGNTMDTAQRFLDVRPENIAGFYDFVSVDGTMPIDRLAQANFYKELLVQMSRVPEFVMQWDIGAMIGHVMKMQGERNIDRFRRMQMNVMPPGAVPGANMVPVGGPQNAGATGTSGGTI